MSTTTNERGVVYCARCATDNLEGSTFCRSCGALVGAPGPERVHTATQWRGGRVLAVVGVVVLAVAITAFAVAAGQGGGAARPTPTAARPQAPEAPAPAGADVPPPTAPPPATAAAPVHAISGTFVLYQDMFTDKGCGGFKGFDDIRVGAQVTVRNSQGAIIGTGQLSNCSFINTRVSHFDAIPEAGIAAEDRQSGTPQFSFSINGIPDSDFYSIEVSHRGQQNYSNADLAARGWQVALTLGP